MIAFVYILEAISMAGIYLITFNLLYLFTKMDVLEIIVVNFALFFPISIFIAGNVEELIRRIKKCQKII